MVSLGLNIERQEELSKTHILIEGCDCSQVNNYTPVDDLAPMNTWAVQICLDGLVVFSFFYHTSQEGVGKGEVDLGGPRKSNWVYIVKINCMEISEKNKTPY